MIRHQKLAYVFMMLLLAAAAGGRMGAQKKGAIKPSVTVAPAAVKPGDKFEVKVTLNLPAGMHINSYKPEDEFAIATELKMNEAAGFTFEAPRYPTGKKQTFSYASQPLTIYEGVVEVTVPVQVSKEGKPGKYSLKGQMRFQPCDAQVCYQPEKAEVVAAVQVK